MMEDAIVCAFLLTVASFMLWISMKGIEEHLMSIASSMAKIADAVKSIDEWKMLGYESGRRFGEKNAYDEIVIKFADLADKLHEASEERKHGTEQ